MATEDLNDRQRQYLLAAFATDQQQESGHQQAFRRGAWAESRRKASDWRAMPFGRRLDLEGQPPTTLREACGGADEGSGATWAALARRGLLTVEDRPVYGAAFPFSLPHITLTPKGRKAARALTGKQPERRPKGVLARRTWQALAAAWRAGDAGLRDDLGGGTYGGLSWDTWLVLRNRKGGELVQEFSRWEPAPRLNDPGHHRRVHVIRLSEQGRQYYAERWAANHLAYPDLDAPAPEELPHVD